MSNKVDTSKWVSKLIYNGTEISLPDADAAFDEGKQEGIDLTMDKLCPQFTESGSVVSCNPLAGYPLSVVSKIKVAQSGTGDPSPTNIRPISGYSTAKLTHAGKNLWPLENEVVAVTATNPHGDCTIYGLPANVPLTASADIIKYADDTATGTRMTFFCYYTDGTFDFVHGGFGDDTEKDGVARRKSITITPDPNKVVSHHMLRTLGCSVIGTARNAKAENIQIEVGETASAYEPYRAQTYEIDLGQTVYSGTLDWSTGVLTVNSKLVTFTGSESFKEWNNSCYTQGWFSDAEVGQLNMIYGHSSHVPNDDVHPDMLAMSFIYHANANGDVQFTGLVDKWGLAEATADAMKAYLAEQYTAGTPVQITYRLANPITIQLTPQEIAALSGINNLYSNIGDTEVSGKADPETSFEMGRKAEYDRFWDEYQNKGGPKNYRCAFNGYGWTEKNFYPKYDIKGGGNTGYQTFMFFNCDAANRINLSQRLKDCGVKLDTSDSTYMQQTFYYANVTVVPEISTIGCTGTLVQTFMNPNVETIEKLILRGDGVQTFNQTFNNATALKNITIDGKIGQNGFDIHWSPLTKASITSIIDALSTTTSGLSITLSKTAVETAFGSTTATEWTDLIKEKSNWTINLA